MSRRVCKLLALAACMVVSLGTAGQQRHLYQDTALYALFGKLEQAGHDTVNIFHLGDSHVQAGFFPGAVAAVLKARFGNAGPGFVFPYSLAGTNGPDQFRWSSNVRWESERIVDKQWTAPRAPGGIVLYSKAPVAQVNARLPEGIQRWLSISDLYKGDSIEADHEIHLPKTADHFTDSWEGTRLAFYGMILRNGEPGVLYHSVGINGAQFMHYNRSEGVIEAQMRYFQPQLVILSLGTNEAFGGVTPAQLRAEMETMTRAIRTHAPGAAILFTTPPSGMMKKRQKPYRKKGSKKVYYRTSYVRNTLTGPLRDAMLSFCRDNGYACWDLYGLMNQDQRFKRAWSPDHIHFNANGYRLQGQLLGDALLQSYSRWKNTLNRQDAVLEKPVGAAAVQ
ncbi:GDSL-type esterase/lipase family protein [Chitinophaga lutea]